MAEVFADWRDVFVAGAGAAAVLLGLVFVAGSIRQGSTPAAGERTPGWRHLLLNRFEFATEAEALATQTYVMFIYAFAFALVMLMPFASTIPPAVLLVAIGGLGLAETALPFMRMIRSTPRPTLFEQAWRYWLPTGAMLAVVGGGLAILEGNAAGIEVVAVGGALLLFGAVRNAWDLYLLNPGR